MIEKNRKQVAFLAEKLMNSKISFGDFLSRLPMYHDTDIDELIDLLEHQPSAQGFFGNKRSHDDYQEAIMVLILKLKK